MSNRSSPSASDPTTAPQARYRILRLKTLLALPAHETARMFRVCPATILRWEQDARADAPAAASLLAPVPPVRRYCDGVRHRYGALGKAGSIALIERFFRTIKTIAGTRARPPLLRADLKRRLGLAFAYYSWLRPHQGLGGATPAETFGGRPAPRHSVIPLPRGRPGEAVPFTAPFEIRYLDPERRLPYLAPKAA